MASSWPSAPVGSVADQLRGRVDPQLACPSGAAALVRRLTTSARWRWLGHSGSAMLRRGKQQGGRLDWSRGSPQICFVGQREKRSAGGGLLIGGWSSNGSRLVQCRIWPGNGRKWSGEWRERWRGGEAWCARNQKGIGRGRQFSAGDGGAAQSEEEVETLGAKEWEEALGGDKAHVEGKIG